MTSALKISFRGAGASSASGTTTGRIGARGAGGIRVRGLLAGDLVARFGDMAELPVRTSGVPANPGVQKEHKKRSPALHQCFSNLPQEFSDQKITRFSNVKT